MSDDVLKLSQLAIALPDLDLVRSRLEAIGLHIEKEEIVPTERVKVGMIPTPVDPHFCIELLEPSEESSPIGKFLESRKNGGLHHIGFSIQNIDKWESRLRDAGFQIIPPGIRPGARGRVLFIHPKSMGGVLVELEEITP